MAKSKDQLVSWKTPNGDKTLVPRGLFKMSKVTRKQQISRNHNWRTFRLSSMGASYVNPADYEDDKITQDAVKEYNQRVTHLNENLKNMITLHKKLGKKIK